MATLKQEAQAYEPIQKTKNIADLDRVPTNIEVHTETVKAGTPDEFSYKYIVMDGEKYRVPGVVIGDIKGILAKRPDTQYVSVIKSGEGVATRYQVLVEEPSKEEMVA